MAAQLDHIIVHSRDKVASARFLTGLLGLPDALPYGPFLEVPLYNGVTLDFSDAAGDIVSQHYAFRVGEDDFDAALARMRQRGVAYWADPGQTRRGEINHNHGGRGLYFEDPDGHLLEILTRSHHREG